MRNKDTELNFLMGGGEIGSMMRNHDWSTSPLGHPETWPQSLRSVVGLLLNSKFPMFVAWGPELGFLYNDSYVDVLGGKHPQALGRRFYDIWSEIWNDIGPLIDCAMAGEASYRENLPLLMRRKGYDEQTWFTFSYSPVRDESGQVAGMYCACFETTAQVLNERHRIKENERLHQLFEQAPGIMTVLREPDHVFELVNHAYLQLIGHRNPIGKTVRESLPEVEGQGFFELLDEVYKTGKTYVGSRMPIDLQRQPQGPLEKRFVDFVYQPIKDDAGKVTGIFIEGSDVTDHYHAQMELQRLNRELTDKVTQLESAERRAMESAQQAERERSRLDALLEAAPVGIALVDINGKLIRINPANKILWGETLPNPENVDEYEEWKGWWADHSVRHGRRLQPYEWALARALHGDNPRDIVEIEPFGMPGVRKTMLNCGAPVRNTEGRIIGAVVAQMDITDQIHAEAALRESEAKFRTITDAMPQMVWSTLPDGYHDYYNQQWYLYTGVPEGSTDGEGWNGVFHPNDQAHAWKVWQHSLATGKQYEIQYRLRHHSGEYRWTLGRALPIRDGSGKIIRWMGTCTDIHDQKLAEEALREADRRKDEFLAMLAHELRNPLAPISAAAELMEVASMDPARIKETSRVISRQVRHMTGLIDDLLDVSRVTRGLVTLEKQELDVKRIVSDAVEQVRPLIESKRHHLSMELAREPAHVVGDQKRLVQVLTNLLNNAAKYTPAGGNIHLKMETTEHEVILSVKDNGIGIAPELQRHIFELFAQAERTSDRSQGGLGIGLALVRSLVELHDGSITCHSEGIGKGSSFTLHLPRLMAQERPTSDRHEIRFTSDPEKRLRILVVDDNEDAGNILGMYLEALGHEVIVERGSRRALERARIEKPEVCILDIGLPDIDGNELARRLRAQPHTAHSTLIAVTGYGQEQDKMNALAAGFAHHLVKPVDTSELLAILSTLKLS
ncbi:PAS domain-containing protein [Oxalobacteraceae bacterium R-40]|uniref:histidine kinase n=1 Tax=Keguizhuia sedimenti TaxID=3064264 RepID=A0ABU1BN93_9BURK|nr:PAS domain-containing protein [Oxalobacteraceae bacterium R-40]